MSVPRSFVKPYRFAVGAHVTEVRLTGDCFIFCPECRTYQPLQVRLLPVPRDDPAPQAFELRNQPRCGRCR